MVHDDKNFPPLQTDRRPTNDPRFSRYELQLAFRNRGLPLEALRYPTTPIGLHYLLTHFDIPALDPTAWRLEVGGLVERPLALDLEGIMARPSITRRVTMECAGNGRALLSPRAVTQPWLLEAVSTAEWAGTPLRGVLEDAGVRAGATDIVFTGADRGMEAGRMQHYQRSLGLGDAVGDDVLLAWGMNGEALPPQHGGPLRLVVPGWYGMASVKWLQRIDLADRPSTGHYMTGTYRYTQHRDDPGEPVRHQCVRALMIAPGVPDYFTRIRLVEAGAVRLEGRAWAGLRAIERVEVSTDDGISWSLAELEPPQTPGCWQAWWFDWQARPGRTALAVRATDDAGEAQPLEPVWNYQGMGNNAAQRVEVIVA